MGDKPKSIQYDITYGDNFGYECKVRVGEMTRGQGDIHITIEFEGSDVTIPMGKIDWFLDCIQDGIEKTGARK